MSITKESELIGMKRVSEVVGTTLKLMREYAKVGISTKELDKYSGEILRSYGAGLGVGYSYTFAEREGYSEDESGLELNMHLRIGYRF